MIEFSADPSQYDESGRILELPLRVRNASARMLVGPLVLWIKEFGSGLGSDFRALAPAVLNASNGVSGEGATFVFAEALGTARTLRPGETSGAIVLRLRLQDPLQVPNMRLTHPGRRHRSLSRARSTR